MAKKINLLDFLTAGDKIYTGGQVYEVTDDKVLSTDGEVEKEEKEKD